MRPQAEIFSQGDEVVIGEIADTNAAWLSTELTALGFDVVRHTAVGDRLPALIALLQEISGRADLCICTGGLGPTTDDLTAEAVAAAFGLPLQFDREAFVQISRFFRQRGRPMPAVNRKQAMLPRGAARLDNLWGTAPGFALTAGRCRFAFMPGVPGEMKAMFHHWVQPDLVRSFPLNPPDRVVLHTIGVGESALQELIDPIGLPASVTLGFRASGAENTVKLLFPNDFPADERGHWLGKVTAALGDAVYAIDSAASGPATLESVVGQHLNTLGKRLYLIETISGGQLTQRCTQWKEFLGANVVPELERLLFWYGVEGREADESVAASLARRALTIHDADFVLVQIAATFKAQPDKSSPSPMFLALAGTDGIVQEQILLSGDGARRQATAAALSLDFLRRQLGTCREP